MSKYQYDQGFGSIKQGKKQGKNQMQTSQQTKPKTDQIYIMGLQHSDFGTKKNFNPSTQNAAGSNPSVQYQQQRMDEVTEQSKKLRIEKDYLESQLRKEKLERTKLELRIKKMESGHEVEKRNIKLKVKAQAKEKYNIRLEEMQKKFKLEIVSLISQFNESRQN